MSSLSRAFQHGWSCGSAGERSLGIPSCPALLVQGVTPGYSAFPKSVMDILLSPQKICVSESSFLLFRPIPSFLSCRDVERIPLISATAPCDHICCVLLYPCWHHSFPVSLFPCSALGAVIPHPVLPVSHLRSSSSLGCVSESPNQDRVECLDCAQTASLVHTNVIFFFS